MNVLFNKEKHMIAEAFCKEMYILYLLYLLLFKSEGVSSVSALQLSLCENLQDILQHWMEL